MKTMRESVAAVKHHPLCKGVQQFILEQQIDGRRRFYRVKCTVCQGTSDVLPDGVDWPFVWRKDQDPSEESRFERYYVPREDLSARG